MKGYTLLITTFLTGLSSGLFYAWAVSVIPGTKRIGDMAYVETMQSINRAIINPWFIVIFLGPVLFYGLSAVNRFQAGDIKTFTIILTAGIVYLIGTIGTTAFGNIPLNEAFDKVSISMESGVSIQRVREAYETKWNRLHLIRTVFSVMAFLLSLVASSLSKTSISIINF